MIRTIIQLTEGQAKGLRERAKQQHISVSALIRELVDAKLAAPYPTDEKRRRALQAIGCVRSGTGDVSELHNEIFAESVLHQ